MGCRKVGQAEAGHVGSGFADIIAWHPERKEIAIIEVKSPAERYAGVEWQTAHNVRGKSRREILDLLRGSRTYYHHPGLVRLYAFTISSQLFSYYREARVYLRKKVKDGEIGQKERVKGFVIIPYLSIPGQNRQLLHEVLRFFKRRRLIRGFELGQADNVAVARIGYYKK